MPRVKRVFGHLRRRVPLSTANLFHHSIDSSAIAPVAGTGIRGHDRPMMTDISGSSWNRVVKGREWGR
jgi:hypothetical protein